MADYNIYIHSVENSGTSGGSGANFNPTTPWGNEENGNESEQLSKETPNFMADSKKTESIAKKAPWVAVAVATIKTSYSIAKTITEFHTINTGDFRSIIVFQNYESMKNAIFHPVSTTIQTLKTRNLEALQNQRREMQRELLGDSEINRYSNKGY